VYHADPLEEIKKSRNQPKRHWPCVGTVVNDKSCQSAQRHFIYSSRADIIDGIIKVLPKRMSLGLFTMFIKIRAHRGEFLNETADRWADEGREDFDNVRWDGPSPHPAFSWTEEGVEHRCSMNKTLRTRVHLKVSELQFPPHKNYTSEFFNRKDNSRDLLGKRWQDKTVSDKSKRRFFTKHQPPTPMRLAFHALGSSRQR